LALVTAAATLIDLVWPRDATNPVWKLDIRVSYWLVGIPLVLGLIYYPLRVHRRLMAEEPTHRLVNLGEPALPDDILSPTS
jgi:hypothetical protein